MRVKVKIAYNGSKFYGSQTQKGFRTVEGELNSALEYLNIHNRVVMGSRTDRGVHATGQVFHLDLPQHWSANRLKCPLQRVVSSGISIISIDEVSNDFHARFSAKSRSYRYLLSTSSPNPFQNDFISFIDGKRFDFSKIEETIGIFRGVHNFEYFHKVGSETKSSIREMFETRAYRWKDIYILKFRANGFLRSQIRMIVASLIEVANGTLSKEQLHQQLKREAIYTRKVAPANGLFLASICY